MRRLENTLVSNSQRAEHAGALVAGVHAGEANAFGSKIGAAGVSPLLSPTLPPIALHPIPNAPARPNRPLIFAPESEVKDDRTKAQQLSDARSARRTQGQALVDLNRRLRKATPEERAGILNDINLTKGKLAEAKGVLDQRLPGASERAKAYQADKTARRNAYLEKHGNTVLGAAFIKDRQATQEKEAKPEGSDFLSAFKGAGDSFKSSSSDMLQAANIFKEAAEALKGIPHTITLDAKSTVFHEHNGQNAINEMTPTFQRMIE
jgi:hypothetical protein